MKHGILIIVLGLFVFNVNESMASEPKAKPNIIFLMTDDQRWDSFGCYGRSDFKTLKIDRLAEQGVIFDNAFYAVSICKPSRVTMMTGRYFSSHRVGFAPPYNYTLSKSDFANSYPAMLKESGYRTGFIGKVGFAITEKAQRPSTVKDYDLAKQMGTTFDYFAGDGRQTGGESKLWPADDLELQEIYQEGRQNTGRTLKTGEAILHFLDTQPNNQPFCLSYSFMAVKHPKDSDIYWPHYELFRDQYFLAPDNWVKGPNDKLPKVIKENWRGPGLHLERSATPELYQKMMRRFATQSYTVDVQVGLMVDKLKGMGILDNIIIIYTSDNGRYQGSHGLLGKALLHEESVKAPLIVFDGRVPESERGRREKALISSVDIAPTILSLAGLEIPAGMQGLDISGILRQKQDMSKWSDAVYMENLFLVELHNAQNREKEQNLDELNEEIIAANHSYRCRGIRTDRWKYFVYYEHNPRIKELYDLTKDPMEQNNLAGDPQFADVLEQLRKRTGELHANAAKAPIPLSGPVQMGRFILQTGKHIPVLVKSSEREDFPRLCIR